MNQFIGAAIVQSVGWIASLFLYDSYWPLKAALISVGIIGLGVVFRREFTIHLPWETEPQKQILRPAIDVVLKHLVDDYSDLKQEAVSVRANVMMLRRKRNIPFLGRLIGSDYLRIDFAFGSYTEAEMELSYGKGIGCSGAAIEKNTQVTFDRNEAADTEHTLSATQREVSRNVMSILSVPIYRPEDQNYSTPIGVLSIDSSDPVSATGFNEEDIVNMASSHSTMLGFILR